MLLPPHVKVKKYIYIVLPSSTERVFIYQGWYCRAVTVVYIINSGFSISSASIIFVQGIVFIQGHGVS